jgi:hypothetical protein
MYSPGDVLHVRQMLEQELLALGFVKNAARKYFLSKLCHTCPRRLARPESSRAGSNGRTDLNWLDLTRVFPATTPAELNATLVRSSARIRRGSLRLGHTDWKGETRLKRIAIRCQKNCDARS